MSNHYHLVVFVDKDRADHATAKDIVDRWHQLFGGTDLSQRFAKDQSIEPWEHERLNTLVDLWRSRLYSISWLMRVLNEQTARLANAEDDCTGRFWEGRYKCQALLDEQAVLSCMAYVDLNPIRAGIASTPESSEFTSIHDRIRYWTQQANRPHKDSSETTSSKESFQPDTLLPLVGNPREPMPTGIAFRLIDYLELVDWTGRKIRDDKRLSLIHI